MIKRHLDHAISTHFNNYKEAIILLGARQVGKTTILKKLFPDSLYLTLDNESVRSALEKYDISSYRQLLNAQFPYLIIDEIQELSNPGRAAKIFYDQLSSMHLILTGSSALNIKNKTSESLAGRKIDYHLFPLTLSEYLVQQSLEKDLTLSAFTNIIHHTLPREIVRAYDHKSILDNVLVYGQYPAMLSHPSQSQYLTNMVDSTIFKDLLELQLLENKHAALSLLKLLSHQIGSLVNYSELASRLGIDHRTVKRYIDLFEQSYLIFRLYPYSTSLRDEIGKAPKIYFYDLGLRNALINNFAPIRDRGDFGQLFENFVILELTKYNEYGNFGYHFNYWRTNADSEVDLVMRSGKNLLAIEIKSKARRVNRAFLTRYPLASLQVVTPDNFWPLVANFGK